MKNMSTKRLVLSDNQSGQHKHVVQSAREFIYERDGEDICFSLIDTGVLTHDEHDRMVFNTGKFHRYHQVEFNPMDGTTDWVFD